MTDDARPLVGRDNELEVLDRLLREACGGTARFAVVTGEPGIGKTSLIGELLRRADARGCLVLEGRATELERELPFGPIVDACDAYLAALDPQTYERLAADELVELAAVFPALRSLRARDGHRGGAAERFLAHHAVRELIERLAARRPVVLALEDLHWSDGASVELIGHLLRRAPDAAVLVALSFRTGRAPPALAAAIDAAARDGVVTQIALGPLAAEDAALLLAPEEAVQRERLYRESGGNPLYLLQLARSRSDAMGLSAAIAAELDGLPAQARAFAQAASVAGDPFDIDLAVATAAVPETSALNALDELLARDVLRPGSSPRSFRFRHPLVRSAIYASCSAGARLAAHERADATLAAWGAPPVARAHHVEHCGRRGDAAAAAVLRDAGRETAQRAPSSAARWFQAALRILPASDSVAERCDLLLGLAEAQVAIGHFEDAHAALRETLASQAGTGSRPRAAVISLCAEVEHMLGRHDHAHTRLAQALRDLPEGDSPDRAALLIDAANDAFYVMDYAAMHDHAAAALDAARRLGDGPLTAAAAAMLAMAEAFVGPIADAQRHCDEAAALVDALPDEAVAQRLDAFAHLSGAEFYLDRYPAGTAHARRGLALVRSTGQGDLYPMMTEALGNMLFSIGRLREAADLLDGVIESARLSGSDISLAWGLLNRGYTAVMAGEFDQALVWSREGDVLGAGLGHSVVAMWTADVHAAALLETGDPAGAAQVMRARCGGEELALIPGGLRANSLEVLTRIRLALGEQAAAVAAATRADEHAEAFGLPMARAFADRAAAHIALAGGDADAAVQHALASAAVADDVGAPVEAGISRTVAARGLARVGHSDAAAAELERAAAQLEQCGALRRRDAAERELRKLGRVVHRRTARGRADADGVASLTGRELEIVRLVVDRRTNPEIAAELFLSIKTVETHMRNIFRKLGASSRVEVARIIERERSVW